MQTLSQSSLFQQLLQHNPEQADRLKQLIIKVFVDGRGLACPMPLLKTKVALRDVQGDEAVYTVATDINSQRDIQAFCQQAGLHLMINQGLSMVDMADVKDTQTANHVDKQQNQAMINQVQAETLNTVFHFIITKNNSI